MDTLFDNPTDKYILMMAIIRKPFKKEDESKRCIGAYDTLDFAQDVSASKDTCPEPFKQNGSGGGMRAIKYKTLTKKNRKLRKRSQRKKKKKGYSSYKFYSSKSKKRSYRRTRKHRK